VIRVSVKDYSREAEAAVQAAAWKRVRSAALALWQALREAVGVPNPAPYRTPSRPGEPPRRRTGRLWEHVQLDVDEAARVARVGLAQGARHGLFLERGTRRVLPRPWFVATLRKTLGAMRALASGGKS